MQGADRSGLIFLLLHIFSFDAHYEDSGQQYNKFLAVKLSAAYIKNHMACSGFEILSGGVDAAHCRAFQHVLLEMITSSIASRFDLD